jgi:hypothetical protein
LRHGASLVRLALGDEHRHEDELPERSAPCPIARPQLDDALGLTLGFSQISELPQAAGGLAGERAFIEAADPRRTLLGQGDRQRSLGLEEKLRTVVSAPERCESARLHGEEPGF